MKASSYLPRRRSARRASVTFPGRYTGTRIASPALVLFALLTASCGPAETPAPDAWAGTPLDGDRILPADTLPTMTGEPFPLASATEGKVTLLFIGYTFCPDICPVHLANLAAVLRDLPLESTRDVTTVFITADPVRDTPERLQEWLGALHPDFVGLRPARQDVNALEDALGLPRSVVDPGEGPEEYFVGHAGQIMVFDREGVARMAYPWGTRQRDWRRDLPRILAGRWPALPAGGGVDVQRASLTSGPGVTSDPARTDGGA